MPRKTQPRPPPARRGALTRPSRQPRREQPTDPSIGKGEDVIRPRDEAADPPHAAPDQSAIDDAAGRGPGEEQGDPADVGADIEADIPVPDDLREDLLLEGERSREPAQVQEDLGGLFGALQEPDGVAPLLKRSPQRLRPSIGRCLPRRSGTCRGRC